MFFPCSVFKVHLSLFAQGSSQLPERFIQRIRAAIYLKRVLFIPEGDTSIIHSSLLLITLKSGGPKWTRFSAEKPRRLQRATGTFPRAAFRVHFGFLSRNAVNIERSRSFLGEP